MLKLEQVRNVLTERAIATLGEGKTVLDFVCDWLAGGRTVVQLAKDIGHSRDTVRRVTYDCDEKEIVDERLRAARAAGAAILVEEAASIADDATENRDAIAKANLRVSVRQWIAGRHNKEQFGDQKSVGLTINIGQLHLDSLRRMNAQERAAPVALPAASEVALPVSSETVDVEIVEN